MAKKQFAKYWIAEIQDSQWWWAVAPSGSFSLESWLLGPSSKWNQQPQERTNERDEGAQTPSLLNRAAEKSQQQQLYLLRTAK